MKLAVHKHYLGGHFLYRSTPIKPVGKNYSTAVWRHQGSLVTKKVIVKFNIYENRAIFGLYKQT